MERHVSQAADSPLITGHQYLPAAQQFCEYAAETSFLLLFFILQPITNVSEPRVKWKVMIQSCPGAACALC